MTFFQNLASVYDADENLDRADLVQTILITAFVALASITIMTVLMQATKKKGDDVSKQISSASPTITSVASTV